jgi:hypothetical protein
MSILNGIALGIYFYVGYYIISYNRRILEQGRESINTCKDLKDQNRALLKFFTIMIAGITFRQLIEVFYELYVLNYKPNTTKESTQIFL